MKLTINNLKKISSKEEKRSYLLISQEKENGTRRSRRGTDQVVHIANPHLYA